ncbi:MAG: hypothetical protein UY22_C0022G0002 [Candidatus Amesbacteria bacterium GW2011_GWC1_48_10]|uniref:Methyltransferase domain-containing protein n=1 Tax=Candidatus Amesbacteria bacterium GW2011_GWC1_48_10 TaxID=1618365 RepID=A0A0G1UG76_9BACT|nr:MAG: hypothetical protein UY22_C0022G0002 [Candidatus Amesbacteria bacterium GW2011_GWC1_48_10]
MAFDRINIVSKWITQRSHISRILDIGFGPADIEQKLWKFRNLIHLRGIDISEKAVDQAKKKFKSWNFQKKSIENTNQKENYFDCILALEVLEHIKPSEILNILKNILKLLRKDGVLIVSVPVNEGLEDMVNIMRNPNAHVRVYTKDLIIAELEMCGYKILKIKVLYAFHSLYKIKSIVCYLFPRIRQPNNIIILAQKL